MKVRRTCPCGLIVIAMLIQGLVLSMTTPTHGFFGVTDDPCPEDTNNDDQVDVDDLIAVILAWGTNDPAADVNNDGIVNVDDLVAVILAWGPCPIIIDPVVIDGFQPQGGGTGDIIQIFGSGFDPDPDNNCAVVMIGNNCSLPLQVLDVSPSPLAGGGQIMTVEVGPVFGGAQPGPIMIARGLGARDFFDATQLPPGVEVQVVEPVWVWNRDPVDGPAGDTGDDFFNPVPPPKPLWIHGEPENGELCLIIPPNVVWLPQQKINMVVRLHNHDLGIGHDGHFPCIIIDNPGGNPVDCAFAICDSMRCAFAQIAGLDVNCDVIQQADGSIKIQVRLKSPTGEIVGIDWGNFDICLVPPPFVPDVIINEIRTDQGGSDLDEYFELRGAPGTPLDGLTYLVIGDGAGGSGTVEHVLDLTGSVIGASGLFVAAEDTFTLSVPDLIATLDFENSDNVTHLLVAGNTATAGDDLDLNDDCVLDATPWASVLDQIALKESDPPDCFYGPAVLGPDGAFVPAHAYRCEPDGTWTIGDFDLGVTDTPGAPNLPCPVVVIVGFDPPSAASGEIITITGRGFGNDPDDLCVVAMVGANCSLPMQALDVSPSPLAGDLQVLTAQVGPVFPGAVPGPIMVGNGQGAFGTFKPGVPGIIVGEPVWIWDHNPTDAPMGNSDDDFTPIPPTEPLWIHGEPENGTICLILPPDVVWCPNQKLQITVRAHNHATGVGHDGFFPCIIFDGEPQGPLDCAARLCDSIRCAFLQQSGLILNCAFVELPDGSVKITIQLVDPATGEVLFIDWGNFDICLLPCKGDPCPWDLNGDGVVDQQDIQIAAGQLGLSCADLPPGKPCADFNGNGIVDNQDLQKIELLIQNGPFPCDGGGGPG